MALGSIERNILGMTWQDRKSNVLTRENTKIKTKSQQLKAVIGDRLAIYVGKTQRDGQEKQLNRDHGMEWEGRGRPKIRWKDGDVIPRLFREEKRTKILVSNAICNDMDQFFSL